MMSHLENETCFVKPNCGIQLEMHYHSEVLPTGISYSIFKWRKIFGWVRHVYIQLYHYDEVDPAKRDRLWILNAF